MSKIPEVKIEISTSNDNFSGTNDKISIIFIKNICIGTPGTPDFRIDLVEIPFILNPDGKDVKAGSTVSYTLKDARFKDESYAKTFRLEKASTFYGKIINGQWFPIPLGFSYSNDWKLKRVRIFYNGKVITDTNPGNLNSKSRWLDKSNYWFMYPDPNDAGPNDCGVCGCVQTTIPVSQPQPQPVREFGAPPAPNSVFIFEPQGVL